MPKPTITFLLGVLIWILVLFSNAQEKKIILNFDDSIIGVKQGEGGYLITTAGQKEFVHILNRKGDIVLKKECKNNFIPYTNLLDDGKKLLLITQGYEDERGNNVYGNIELIHVPTNQTRWKHKVTAGGFVVAPGNKFVASSNLAIDMKTDFVIINMENGELVDLNSILGYQINFTTTWLDSIRLCVLSYQEQPNPKYKAFNSEYKQFKDKIDSAKVFLYKSILQLEQVPKEKNTHENKRKLTDLKAQWQKTLEESMRKEIQWRREYGVDKFIPAPAKVFIINALTKSIENEKLLADLDGKPFPISGQYNTSKLLTNRSGEIIFEVVNMLTQEYVLVKTDKNLITKSYTKKVESNHPLSREFQNLINERKQSYRYEGKSLIVNEEE